MNKRFAIAGLIVLSAAITVSGIGYGIYGIINGTSFRILNTDLPGFILGAIAAFLGIRYLKAAIGFGKELKKTDSSFTWSNFKRVKPNEAKVKGETT